MSHWKNHATWLADAFERRVYPVRYELVTRAILAHLPQLRQNILDLGGGFGRQAILLARAGHRVTIVDFDANAIRIARDARAAEPAEVRDRVELVLGELPDTPEYDGRFALACCHSVLMYEPDPRPLLGRLVRSVRPGGLLSVLSLNADAVAMRSGLQGRWREAAHSIRTGEQDDADYLPTADHTRGAITMLLQELGARERAWYGVGIFTDHLPLPPDGDDLAQICELEWLAGCKDPYRLVARCFHLIAERL